MTRLLPASLLIRTETTKFSVTLIEKNRIEVSPQQSENETNILLQIITRAGSFNKNV